MDISPKISEKDVEYINKILSSLKQSPYLVDEKACKLLMCGNDELERYKDIILYYGGARLNDYKYLMVNDDTARYLATNKYQTIFESQKINSRKEDLTLEKLKGDIKNLKRNEWKYWVGLVISLMALLISLLDHFRK